MSARQKIIEAIASFPFQRYGMDVDPRADTAEWVPVLADRICDAIDDQPHHVLDLTDTGWTLKHPLDCRDELFECPYNRAADRLEGPPAPLGRYYVTVDGHGALVVGDHVTRPAREQP